MSTENVIDPSINNRQKLYGTSIAETVVLHFATAKRSVSLLNLKFTLYGPKIQKK